MNDTISTEVPSEAGKKKILVLGLGTAGVKVVRRFSALPGCDSIPTVLVDTDNVSFQGEHAPSCKCIQAQSSLTIRNGLGCGGDIMAGQRAVGQERHALMEAMTGFDFLIIAAGLGGGTATGGIEAVIQEAKKLKIPVALLLTTPFSFESYTKRKNANQCIENLRIFTDVLIQLPNDLLFATMSPDAPAAEAFEASVRELAKVLFGITELFSGKNLFGPGFAEISSILKKDISCCSVGIGSANSDDGLDRCSLALERMLETPFLGGISTLSDAHAVILTVTGGEDLQISEVKRALENAGSQLPKSVSITAGATIHPDFKNRIQLTALAVRYEHAGTEMRPGEKATVLQPGIFDTVPGSRTLEQGELGLQSFSKGIFGNMLPVKYRDEDLDVPTFQRRNITIDKGAVNQ